MLNTEKSQMDMKAAEKTLSLVHSHLGKKKNSSKTRDKISIISLVFSSFAVIITGIVAFQSMDKGGFNDQTVGNYIETDSNITSLTKELDTVRKSTHLQFLPVIKTIDLLNSKIDKVKNDFDKNKSISITKKQSQALIRNIQKQILTEGNIIKEQYNNLLIEIDNFQNIQNFLKQQYENLSIKIKDIEESQNLLKEHYREINLRMAAKVVLPFPYKNSPAPVYPKTAKVKGFQGIVELNVFVTKEGKVAELKVEKSSGYKILDKSALKAVKKWRFSPGSKGYKPCEMWVKIPVEFGFKKG